MEAKAYFQQTNAAGVSLHSHLTEVIHKLITSKDPNALENFENISLETKKAHFTAAEPGAKNVCPPPAPTDEAWKKRSNALFRVDAGDSAGVPNLLEEASLFEWAGIGLAVEEVYRLFLAMTGLKASQKLKSVRFFGKIFGTAKDYYIVEGEFQELPKTTAVAVEGATPPEPPGTGLNQYAYFVTNDISEPFSLLPDVTPAQVVAAALLKKYFTGNLDAPVRCFPPFMGNESVFLRAQIARIYAATKLAPEGKFKLDEEVETGPQPLVEEPEYEAAGAADMLEADKWCHLVPKILKIGRCTNPVKEGEGEEGGEEEVEEPEEETPALTAVSADEQISELMPEMPEPAWSIKQYGSRDAAVVIAKSNRWPGAFSAFKGGKFANLYMGDGSMRLGGAFTPVAPPKILGEPEDAEEQPDVTLEAENEVLKAIEEAKMAAEAAAEEEAEE